MARADLIDGPDEEADIDDTGENALADNRSDESLATPTWQPRARPQRPAKAGLLIPRSLAPAR